MGEEIPPAVVMANLEAESLSSKMSRLLDRALDQSTSSSQVELFHHILDQLVADEARIIGALSDGSASPLVNVHDGVRRGVAGRAVLENASLIGRTANLALPAMVPTYVGHLLSLGLVEIGPEAPNRRRRRRPLRLVLDSSRSRARTAPSRLNLVTGVGAIGRSRDFPGGAKGGAGGLEPLTP
jgi:Abortive infection alpha